MTIATLVALILAAIPAAAGGINCAAAKSPADRTICASPELRAADFSLATHYDIIRRALTKPLAATLVAGQQAWLAARDRDCAASACLSARIDQRDAVLAALAARVSESNPSLPDLTAVWIEGSWRADVVMPPDIQPASDLPEPGSILTLASGRLCIGGDCTTFGLEPQKLEDGPGRQTLPNMLKLSPAVSFYLVYLNGKAAYGLVPVAGGAWLAISPGCDRWGKACQFAHQTWQPIDPVGRLHRESAILPSLP